MHLAELQGLMRRLYLERDRSRGVDATFRWMVEEIGEVARAIRAKDHDEIERELSDAIAWLASLANLLEVDLERAADRYATGCPKCGRIPCACPFAGAPAS